MSTQKIWDAKLRKPNKPKETVALINLKGFNEKDDPVELSDVIGTAEQLTVYDKPTGRIGLKEYINKDLAKTNNKLFEGFTKIINKKSQLFADTLVDMVLKTQLKTKLEAKKIGDLNFEFALVTGFADYTPNKKDPSLDKLTLRPATFIPLHTILCGLANLAGANDPYVIEVDTLSLIHI